VVTQWCPEPCFDDTALGEVAPVPDKPIAIVTGVGPGTGSAIVRRFVAGGFRVIALARSPDRIRALEQELPDTHAVICDVSSEKEVADAVGNVRKSYGAPNVLIHNAVGGGWGTFLEIEPQMLERNFRVNVMGLLYLAREVAPDMIKAGNGAILVTGNTSAVRGKANFAGFAPTKAAQRILAESIARSRTARHPRRLCPYRRRDRWAANARTSARCAGRVLHQTIRNCRRNVAPPQSGPLRMVVPDRASPIRRTMVR
jgi:NAD(P)-dependent dehydrogenase (short-subunit alcohol dehydrogenase family)